MALHRFEEQAGKKLRERQIAPSAGSWEKLEAKLGKDEGKRNLMPWWPLVAAVVVLAFLAGSQFFRIAPESRAIVEEPTKIPENTPETEVFKTPVEIASEESDRKPAKTEKEAPAEQIPQQPIQENKPEELVAATAEIEKLHFELENINLAPPLQEETPVKTQLEEAIAMVVSEQAKRDLTDAEVDDLLLEAASQFTRQQAFGNDGRVNASALLADVETELDQSFRQKVFEMLKDGFEEASYAFTNRNK